MAGEYYVYTHRDPDTQRCKYAGMGIGARAWAYRSGGAFTSSSTRHADHAEYLQDLIDAGHSPDSWVQIVAGNLSKEAAREIERVLIREWKPCFNIQHTGIKRPGRRLPLTAEQVAEAREAIAEGATYRSVARKHGVSEQHVHDVVRGPEYARKRRGLMAANDNTPEASQAVA